MPTKQVNGFQNLTCEDRIKTKETLTTLERRRKRRDLIEVLKILTGREKVDKRDFFKQNKSVYNWRTQS